MSFVESPKTGREHAVLQALPELDVRPEVLRQLRKFQSDKEKILVSKEVLDALQNVSQALDDSQRLYMARKEHGAAAERVLQLTPGAVQLPAAPPTQPAPPPPPPNGPAPKRSSGVRIIKGRAVGVGFRAGIVAGARRSSGGGWHHPPPAADGALSQGGRPAGVSFALPASGGDDASRGAEPAAASSARFAAAPPAAAGVACFSAAHRSLSGGRRGSGGGGRRSSGGGGAARGVLRRSSGGGSGALGPAAEYHGAHLHKHPFKRWGHLRLMVKLTTSLTGSTAKGPLPPPPKPLPRLAPKPPPEPKSWMAVLKERREGLAGASLQHRSAALIQRAWRAYVYRETVNALDLVILRERVRMLMRERIENYYAAQAAQLEAARLREHQGLLTGVPEAVLAQDPIPEPELLNDEYIEGMSRVAMLALLAQEQVDLERLVTRQEVRQLRAQPKPQRQPQPKPQAVSHEEQMNQLLMMMQGQQQEEKKEEHGQRTRDGGSSNSDEDSDDSKSGKANASKRTTVKGFAFQSELRIRARREKPEESMDGSSQDGARAKKAAPGIAWGRQNAAAATGVNKVKKVLAFGGTMSVGGNKIAKAAAAMLSMLPKRTGSGGASSQADAPLTSAAGSATEAQPAACPTEDAADAEAVSAPTKPASKWRMPVLLSGNHAATATAATSTEAAAIAATAGSVGLQTGAFAVIPADFGNGLEDVDQQASTQNSFSGAAGRSASRSARNSTTGLSSTGTTSASGAFNSSGSPFTSSSSNVQDLPSALQKGRGAAQSDRSKALSPSTRIADRRSVKISMFGEDPLAASALGTADSLHPPLASHSAKSQPNMASSRQSLSHLPAIGHASTTSGVGECLQQRQSVAAQSHTAAAEGDAQEAEDSERNVPAVTALRAKSAPSTAPRRVLALAANTMGTAALPTLAYTGDSHDGGGVSSQSVSSTDAPASLQPAFSSRLTPLVLQPGDVDKLPHSPTLPSTAPATVDGSSEWDVTCAPGLSHAAMQALEARAARSARSTSSKRLLNAEASTSADNSGRSSPCGRASPKQLSGRPQRTSSKQLLALEVTSAGIGDGLPSASSGHISPHMRGAKPPQPPQPASRSSQAKGADDSAGSSGTDPFVSPFKALASNRDNAIATNTPSGPAPLASSRSLGAINSSSTTTPTTTSPAGPSPWSLGDGLQPPSWRTENTRATPGSSDAGSGRKASVQRSRSGSQLSPLSSPTLAVVSKSMKGAAASPTRAQLLPTLANTRESHTTTPASASGSPGDSMPDSLNAASPEASMFVRSASGSLVASPLHTVSQPHISNADTSSRLHKGAVEAQRSSSRLSLNPPSLKLYQPQQHTASSGASGFTLHMTGQAQATHQLPTLKAGPSTRALPAAADNMMPARRSASSRQLATAAEQHWALNDRALNAYAANIPGQLTGLQAAPFTVTAAAVSPPQQQKAATGTGHQRHGPG